MEAIFLLRSAKTVIYKQRIKNKAVADNLKNVIKLRHQLPESEKLYPLPFFFMEKRVLLGQMPSLDWSSLYCPHGHFVLNYYDVFNPKTYTKLLYDNEHKNIENSKMLRPERNLIHKKSFFLNKLLLGTTLLPRSVADCVFEGSDSSKMQNDWENARDRLYHAWELPRCNQCLSYFTRVKRKREVERYLFLKYQSKVAENFKVAISKVWAYAWVDYLFYDTDIFYSITQNKNYELPSPPIPYTFTSGPKDPMLAINPAHSYLIRRLYTNLREDGTLFLSKADSELLEKAANDELHEETLAIVSRLSSSLVADILRRPGDWSAWLQLFDNENIYEETVMADDRPETSAIDQTVKEISSIQKLEIPADVLFDPSSAMDARPWRRFFVISSRHPRACRRTNII